MAIYEKAPGGRSSMPSFVLLRGVPTCPVCEDPLSPVGRVVCVCCRLRVDFWCIRARLICHDCAEGDD
jgi:hypothetical protein